MLSEARIENEERDLLVVRGDRWCWSGTRGCLLLAAIGIEWAQQRQQQRQQSLLRSACSERGQMLCCWCCSSGTSLLSAARRLKFALRSQNDEVENEHRDLLVVRADSWCWSGTGGRLLSAGRRIKFALSKDISKRRQS